MRSQKVLKNGLWGVAYQVLSIALGFVGRTCFIYCLGKEYLGISGLFTNVLSVFSMTELGFSTAVSYHLYRLLAVDDKKEIAGVMQFYKSVYRIVALAIAAMGVAFLPFLKYIIAESSFSLKYICTVYLFFVFKSASSYLFSYNNTIATADQKQYILTKIDIIGHIVLSLSNIIVLLVFRNYLVYLAVEIILGFAIRAIKAIRVKREYPYINENVEISPERKRRIFTDVKNIFFGKVSTVIVTSTDNILISALVNLSTVGYYSNYSFIINYIQLFLSQFTSATQASLGSLLANESKDYSYLILKRLTTILYIATSFCAVSLFTLLNPFISLWVGQDYLLDMGTVFLCVVNFYIQILKTPLWFSLGGTGLFKEDRNIAIWGAASNLVVSLILGYFWGINGILFGTTFSQLLQWFLKYRLFVGAYLQRKSNQYAIMTGNLLLLTCVMCIATNWVSSFITLDNVYVSFLIKCVICVLFPNAVNFFILGKSEDFRYMLMLIRDVIIKRRK